MIPTFENQAAERIPAGVDARVEHIAVGGNVDGTLLVGNENIVGSNNVVYKVNTGHGTVVNIAEAAPAVSPRTMRGQPLVPPPYFTGRESYLEKIADYVSKNQRVLLYGPDGIGKSALLAQASNSEAALAKRSGVVHVEGIDEEGLLLGPTDIIQRLFDSLFESDPPLKVTYPTARIHLSNTEPLVVLDHLSIPIVALNRLPGLFSTGAALLVANQEAPLDSPFLPVRVLPLKRPESIQMFSKKSGIAADDTTREPLDRLCDLLGDVPLAIAKTATALRLKGWDLKSLAETLSRLQQTPAAFSQDPVQGAIERDLAVIFSNLNAPEQRMLSIAAAAPGKSVDRPWLESVAGGPETSRALEDQEVLVANSPRLRVPERKRSGFHYVEANLREHRELLLRYLLEKFKPPADLEFDSVADELGNLLGLMRWASNEGRWADVIALGRAVDPYLTLHGLWDAWEEILKQVLTAAQHLGELGARGWALHQLGSRAIGVGSRKQAIGLLQRALSIRLARGDLVGAAYTLHNLRLLLPPNRRENGKDNGNGEPGQNINPVEPEPPYPKPTFWEKFLRFLGANALPVAGGLLAAAVIAVAALQPALALKMEANPGRYNPAGQTIEYSYIVENARLVKLAGPISVSTEDQSQVICPDLDTIGNGNGFLDWNESLTCTSFYTITEADVQNGSVTNKATASEGEGRVQATRLLTLARDDKYVLLDIEANPTTYRKPGDTITVAYRVRNVGKEALGGLIAVTANLLQIKCPGAQQVGNGNSFLDAGESLVCTSTYRVTQADIDVGYWTTTAAVSVGDFKSDPQTITVYGVLPSQLTLRKSAKPAGYRDLGQEIQYTYEVRNQGNNPLIGPVIVSDDRLEVACPEILKVGNLDDYLDPDELVVCNATYKISDADIKNESVTNTAYARTKEIQSEPQSLTIPYLGPQPPTTTPLGLTKSADPRTYRGAGESVKYIYDVTNEGSDPLPGPVTISDDKTNVGCPDLQSVGNEDGFLDRGEVLTCTAAYDTTQSDVDRRSVTNTATAIAGEVQSEPASTTITLELPRPVLFKSAEPGTYGSVGQVIQYTYLVTNPGSLPIDGFVDVRDDKADVSCSQINVLVQRDSVLSPGESYTCTGTYTITDADMRDGSVTNTAWAIVGHAISEPQSLTIFKEPVPPPILKLTKTAEPELYRASGDQIRYTYFIQNAGKGPAKGPVTVKDDKAQVSCPDINKLGDLDGALDPGEWLTCTATYAITDEDFANGSVTNTATASAGEVSSNRSSATVYAKALNLTGAADPPEYLEAGTPIQYSYKVTGKSKLPLAGPVIIKDDKIQANCPNLDTIGNQDGNLDWNEEVTCTGNYTVLQADIDTIPEGSDRGVVTNTAEASAGDISSNRVSFRVQGPVPMPGLTLNKTAEPKTYDTVGQVITYTYAATNTGNVTLSPPIQIRDDHVRNAEAFPCGNTQQGLAPKESVTCTETYTIVQADFGSKSVTNSATASAAYRGSEIKSTPAQVTITCPAPPTRWVPYTVENGISSLTDIDSWYAETAADLQRANCLGSSDYVYPGQVIYVPGPPPAATISGTVRDTARQPLGGILVRLISNGIVIDSATTDGNGRYTLSAPNPGDYQIFRTPVTLQRGNNRTRDFDIVLVGQ